MLEAILNKLFRSSEEVSSIFLNHNLKHMDVRQLQDGIITPDTFWLGALYLYALNFQENYLYNFRNPTPNGEENSHGFQSAIAIDSHIAEWHPKSRMFYDMADPTPLVDRVHDLQDLLDLIRISNKDRVVLVRSVAEEPGYYIVRATGARIEGHTYAIRERNAILNEKHGEKLEFYERFGDGTTGTRSALLYGVPRKAKKLHPDAHPYFITASKTAIGDTSVGRVSIADHDGLKRTAYFARVKGLDRKLLQEFLARRHEHLADYDFTPRCYHGGALGRFERAGHAFVQTVPTYQPTVLIVNTSAFDVKMDRVLENGRYLAKVNDVMHLF